MNISGVRFSVAAYTSISKAGELFAVHKIRKLRHYMAFHHKGAEGYHYEYILEIDDRSIQFWLNGKRSGMAFSVRTDLLNSGHDKVVRYLSWTLRWTPL